MAKMNLRTLVLGTALALAGAGAFVGIDRTSPKIIQKGNGWYSFKEDGDTFLNKGGVIYTRYVSIPSDINRVGDKDYETMMQEEIRECEENLDYNSPYAVEDHLEFVRKQKTPLERIESSIRNYSNDLTTKIEERNRERKEAAERATFVAP